MGGTNSLLLGLHCGPALATWSAIGNAGLCRSNQSIFWRNGVSFSLLAEAHLGSFSCAKTAP